MTQIRKAPETMTARERIRATFAHEKTDRVSIGYKTNDAVHKRLAIELGIPDGDYEKVLEALGVDYRELTVPYIGKPLFEVPENRRVNPLLGCIMRWAPNEMGGYWDYCDFPLKDAEDEDFEKFPIPNPDDFDYDAALEIVKNNPKQYAFHLGNAAYPDVINGNGCLMGMEDVLCHLLLKDEAALDFMNRRADYQVKMMERTLEKCKGYIDFMWLGEDLGTQHAPMISLQLYRDVIKPIHKRFTDLAKAYDIPVMIHSCGCSSWAYPDYIDIGINAVDNIQPDAANMDPAYLVKTFGKQLAYRGCISTGGPLAFGTPDEVRKNVNEVMDIMMPNGGYFFAPSHRIQDNTPVENIIAMYQAAHDYGRE